MLGLLVATITNVWHQHLTLKPPADPVVNTPGLTPAFLEAERQRRLQDVTGSMFLLTILPLSFASLQVQCLKSLVSATNYMICNLTIIKGAVPSLICI